jgi:phage FluMu protein gp41
MHRKHRNTFSMEMMEGRDMMTAGFVGNISGLAGPSQMSKVSHQDFTRTQISVDYAFASSSLGDRTVDPTVNHSLAWELYGD